jgi:hypothetical protein
MTARVAPEPMPSACNPNRIARSSHVASRETPAINSEITVRISSHLDAAEAHTLES